MQALIEVGSYYWQYYDCKMIRLHNYATRVTTYMWLKQYNVLARLLSHASTCSFVVVVVLFCFVLLLAKRYLGTYSS